MTDVGMLIVDDEEDIRELIRMAIDMANEGLFVCGEAGDGAEALERVAEMEPHVVVLDERMPGLSGLETAMQLLADHPDQRIVLCSAYLDSDLRRRADDIGITACLPKRDISRIPEVIRMLTA